MVECRCSNSEESALFNDRVVVGVNVAVVVNVVDV